MLDPEEIEATTNRVNNNGEESSQGKGLGRGRRTSMGHQQMSKKHFVQFLSLRRFATRKERAQGEEKEDEVTSGRSQPADNTTVQTQSHEEQVW